MKQELIELIERAATQADEDRKRAGRIDEALRTFGQELKELLGISQKVDITQAAVQVLLERNNNPTSVADFVGPMEQMGIVLTGQDPVANLSSRLSREAGKPDGRLISNGPRKGYQLRDHEQEKIRAGLNEIGFTSSSSPAISVRD